MASRWAYEALAVVQAVDNEHERSQFDLHHRQSNASWKRDYWIPEMKNQLNILADKKSSPQDFEKAKLFKPTLIFPNENDNTLT